MYNFRDLKMNSEKDEYIPSQALLIDGVSLESLIDGYKTLEVEGRELLGTNIEMYESIPGMHGKLIKEITYPSRYITVKYMIEANSDEEFRDSFNKLNEIFYGKLLYKKYVNFNDEKDKFFEVVLKETTNVDTKSNTTKGSFTLFCETPFKYSEIKTTSGKVNSKYKSYPVKLEEVKVNITSPVGEVEIKNITNNKKIVLKATFKSGDEIKIIGNKILVNGLNKTEYLDYLTSDFKGFTIKDSDVIQITPTSAYQIKYREVAL